MEQQPYLLPIKQAAVRLGMPYRQLLEEVNAGRIPHYRVGKSHRLVSLSEVLDFTKSTNEGDLQ